MGTKKVTPEGALLSQITDWLGYSQFRDQWWRVPLGPVLRNGGAFYSKNPMTGFPDLCVLSVRFPGQLYTIELKSLDGRLSPAQVGWRSKLLAAGVKHATIRTLQDFIATLQDWERGGEQK